MRRVIICFFVLLFFFLLGASVLADEIPEGVRCLPEQPPEAYGEDEALISGDRYGVPRKQVLVEIATGTW
jgi:hypothetical protein